MASFKAACVQLNSGNDMAANLRAAGDGVRNAVKGGAQLVMLPEYVALLDGSGRVMRENSYPEDQHPALSAFQALAGETRAWLLVGSLTVKIDGAPASSEQGSRLRDANVRESGAALSSAGVASVSGVTSPEGARRRAEEGSPWGSDPEDAHRAGIDAPMAGSTVASPQVGPLLRVTPAPVPPSDGVRMANRSYLLTADGTIAARYDKIHMFDAALPSGKAIRESGAYRPGARSVVTRTPWGPLGMTVCYDLRFPHLYRALAKAGAMFLAVPSSFQRETGVTHWHALLRARAIENLSYVFAPAMCGEHPGNRSTYGHSLIIDPWGKILAELGDEPGIAIADIDADEVARVRGMLPSLEHDREFAAPGSGAGDRAP